MVLRTPSLRSNPPLSRLDISLAGLSKRIKRRYLALAQRSGSKRYRLISGTGSEGIRRNLEAMRGLTDPVASAPRTDTPHPTIFAKPRYVTNPKGGLAMFAQCLLFCIVLAATTVVAQRAPRSFPVEETTIAQIHAAMREHRLTCRELVDAYLKRINAYDKRGPAIN